MDVGHPGSQQQTGNLLRQQAVLAQFGELALKSEDLDEILTVACELVGQALHTDLAMVVELQTDGETLIARAGVGWKPGVVGVAQLKLDERSSEGHALKTGEPMISPDIEKETRFHYADFLKEHGVKAIVNVAILGSEAKVPFGILQVDSRKPREFTEADILFLRSYANLLGAAVARLRVFEKMKVKNAKLAREVERCRLSAEHQIFLTREMDHRAKNMLAVIQAVVRLTKASDIPEFVHVIEGRIKALARAQALLSADRWAGADLHTLVRGELAQFLDGSSAKPQVKVDGLPVYLPPGAAQPISMALHEMTTNAIKYGALANPEGRLHISWQVERGTRNVLKIRWTESGGPVVDGAPARRGFGSRLLTDTLRTQLGGTILMTWEKAGLVCDFEVPLPSTKLGAARQNPAKIKRP